MFIKNKNQIILLMVNVFLIFFLILLSNMKVLPLQLGDFIFFAILTLALALYRPGWVFLFFAGTVMLENINLAPAELGIAIRPYQFFGGLTILAIIIRLSTNRLNFKLTKLIWYDFLIIIMGVASFLSVAGSQTKGVSLKQSVIVVSFIFLYFLARNYVQTTDDLKKIIPFFLSSSVVVMFYGIWQNVRFLHNLSSFEVMPGRPNASFAEADWLGIFLVLLLAAMYSVIYFFDRDRDNAVSVISNFQFPIFKQFSISKYQIFKTALYLFLTLVFISLILTVSRSAWLGALGVTAIFLFVAFTDLKWNFQQWQWKETIRLKIKIISAFIISLAIVYIFSLTNFQLFNRVRSTGTGLQKITIACPGGLDMAIPQTVNSEDEYVRYGCRHINLEEIDQEKKIGNIVSEIYRKDPNVNIRSVVYGKSWRLIKEHPVLGIGWGTISDFLGTDERGAGLNASNIFLEVWLGAGLLGLLSFIAIWAFVIAAALKNFLRKDTDTKTAGLFILLGFFALLIPNMFNSGILLGFLWLFLAVAGINPEKIKMKV